MEKYIWIVYFVNEAEVMAAENAEAAYSIMEEHIKNLGELNVPSESDAKMTCQEEALIELRDSFDTDVDYFGVLDICHTERIPLYSTFKR